MIYQQTENIAHQNSIPTNESIGEVLTFLFKSGLVQNTNVKDVFSLIQPVENNVENKSIKSIKIEIKNTLIDNTSKAINMLKDSIIPECERFDQLIGLMSRYNRVNTSFHAGIVDYELYDREVTRIVNNFLYIVNSIEDEYFISKYQ